MNPSCHNYQELTRTIYGSCIEIPEWNKYLIYIIYLLKYHTLFQTTIKKILIMILGKHTSKQNVMIKTCSQVEERVT